jgi:hypothetical protein
MRRPIRFALILAILILAAAASRPLRVFSQDSGDIYVEETGHWIRGEFARVYRGASDPLVVFGYPVTDGMADTLAGGGQGQYFQKVRLDLFNGRVVLAPLGQQLYEPGVPTVAASRIGSCRHFSQTGFSVCSSFLDFYERYNGEIYFGSPISGVEEKDGRLVQNFQFVRMEWRPEMPSGQRVGLSDLGLVYMRLQGVEGASGLDTILAPMHARVNAFVSRPLAPVGGGQKLSVIVQDQHFQPISGVMLEAQVFWPGAEVQTINLDPTNADGISQLEFSVLDSPLRQVVLVRVKAYPGGEKVEASTWFRVWW